jgi:tetratricopeptide (TPR) repeat protein
MRWSMETPEITTLIEQVFATLQSPVAPLTPDLDLLFQRLHAARDEETVTETEARIWQAWCSHSDRGALHTMNEVIRAFSAGDLAIAETELNKLIARWPEWVEAWNKRATLRFAQERDAESLRDIVATLCLEPRHFGALAGFGQICLRAGDAYSALLAFEAALQRHPHLPSIQEAVRVLRQKPAPIVH